MDLRHVSSSWIRDARRARREAGHAPTCHEFRQRVQADGRAAMARQQQLLRVKSWQRCAERLRLEALQQQGWSCSQCTFHNEEGASACTMCGCAKPSLQSKSPSAADRETAWSCRRCTMENAPTARVCTACGGRRPPPQAVRRAMQEWSQKWLCARCSHPNARDAVRCAMCMAEHPSRRSAEASVPLMLSDVRAESGQTYAARALQLGCRLFADSDAAVTGAPAWALPQADGKAQCVLLTGPRTDGERCDTEAFLSFTPWLTCWLYVGLDAPTAEAAAEPDWLRGGYASTGDVIVSSEPHIGYYSLFRRAAPVRGGEACSLPSRDARGWTGAHSHYLVLLRPATLAELEGAQPRAAAAAGAAGAEAGPSLR